MGTQPSLIETLEGEPQEFLALVVAAQNGVASWEVVADWLEERGDRRGADLRAFLAAPAVIAKSFSDAIAGLTPTMVAFVEAMRQAALSMMELMGVWITESGRVAIPGRPFHGDKVRFFMNGQEFAEWHPVPPPLVSDETLRRLRHLASTVSKEKRASTPEIDRRKREHQERLRNSQPWRRR